MKQITAALFWVVTQQIVSIPRRRFGTTYRSSIQGSRILISPSTFVWC